MAKAGKKGSRGEKSGTTAVNPTPKRAAKKSAAKRTKKPAATKTPPTKAPAKKPAAKAGLRVLLSGGNPQVAKADGVAPVREYIVAMPGWKRDVGERLDALIERCAPGVRRAVRWNSPFYGIEGQGWFVSYHVFAKYVKVTFFRGKLLAPLPPGGTAKSGDARWIDIHEGEACDDARMRSWIRQAAAMPGWMIKASEP